jgi:hypothetical protein
MAVSQSVGPAKLGHVTVENGAPIPTAEFIRQVGWADLVHVGCFDYDTQIGVVVCVEVTDQTGEQITLYRGGVRKIRACFDTLLSGSRPPQLETEDEWRSIGVALTNHFQDSLPRLLREADERVPCIERS